MLIEASNRYGLQNPAKWLFICVYLNWKTNTAFNSGDKRF
jgi:hypothetical protein